VHPNDFGVVSRVGKNRWYPASVHQFVASGHAICSPLAAHCSQRSAPNGWIHVLLVLMMIFENVNMFNLKTMIPRLFFQIFTSQSGKFMIFILHP